MVDNPRFQHSLPGNRRRREGLLGVFAKAPRPGGVKTRLCPPLSPAGAALLYRTALDETLAGMRAAGYEPVLFFAGEEDFFARRFPDLTRVPQGEGSLGERLDRAFKHLLAKGRGPAAVIGTDSPDLPTGLVDRALAALETREVVAVPARDGGYVLIGESRHRPELFRKIPWSTGGVLAATRERAAAAGIDYLELGCWEDLDDAAALGRLVERSPDSRTARLAARLLRRAPWQGPLRTAGDGPDAGRQVG